MINRFFCIRFWIIIFFFCCFLFNLFGQLSSIKTSNLQNNSVLGYSGLIYTPSAYISQWGQVRIGVTHYDSHTRFTTYGDLTKSERSFWGNISFLPFAELTIRLTKPYNSEKQFGIGDRSISFRGQILKENKKRPAILIGIQDVFTQVSFFSAAYIVATKTFNFEKLEVVSNIGYGFKRKNARKDILQGGFYGMQLRWKKIQGLLEYDADYVNVGIGYQFKNILSFNIALAQLKYLTGSLSVNFSLK